MDLYTIWVILSNYTIWLLPMKHAVYLMMTPIKGFMPTRPTPINSTSTSSTGTRSTSHEIRKLLMKCDKVWIKICDGKDHTFWRCEASVQQKWLFMRPLCILAEKNTITYQMLPFNHVVATIGNMRFKESSWRVNNNSTAIQCPQALQDLSQCGNSVAASMPTL